MVKIREFRASLKKYFDEAKSGSVDIERDGLVYTLKLKGKENKAQVYTSNEEMKHQIAEIKRVSMIVDEYGCGCTRTGSTLCQKHGRY